ncbi:hypothetical protein HDV00_001003 [Rhizophlyctis rosea]|nr:hypothetical protein HDV00_001003 [Rhizophlyctis rosea]
MVTLTVAHRCYANSIKVYTVIKIMKQQALILLWFLTKWMGVSTFGRTGHYVIGEATSQLVANGTLAYIADEGYFEAFKNSWGLSSIEADNFKRRLALRWTKTWHFWNPDDDPPTKCPGVRGWNETKGGNVLKGMERFSNLLITGKGQAFSALLLVHFLQEIWQPLHVSKKAHGGNDVTVTYRGRRVNLHRLWDSVLVQELADRAGGTDALIKEIVDTAEPRFCAARRLTDGSWMDDVVAKANENHHLNCKIVWVDELRTPEHLLPVMHGLLVEAARFSACHWDWLAYAARARQIRKAAGLTWSAEKLVHQGRRK